VETPTHLCKDCTFTKQAWEQLTRWYNLAGLPPSCSASSLLGWWKKSRKLFQKLHKAHFDGLIISFWWNMWKEQNRRTFNQESKTFEEVAFLTREEVQHSSIWRQDHHKQTQAFFVVPFNWLVVVFWVSVVVSLVSFAA
jgi:hypothetical protein